MDIEVSAHLMDSHAELMRSYGATRADQTAARLEALRVEVLAARGTREVSSNIAGVSMSAAETGKTSSTVLHAANALSDQALNLQHQVDEFFTKIKVA